MDFLVPLTHPALKGLRKKQALFVLHYLANFNAAAAARLAKYSPRTAKQQGYENLTKPYVQEALRKILDELTQSLSTKILERHEVLGFDSGNVLADITDAVPKDGKIDLKSLPDHLRLAIQEIKYDCDGNVVSVRLHGKHPSLERLAKYHGILARDPNERHGELGAGTETVDGEAGHAVETGRAGS